MTDWTESERRELSRIRQRGQAVRALRAIASGLAIVVALRTGIPHAVAAWLLAMLILQAMEPEIPHTLRSRAQEIDRQRAQRRAR